MQKINYLILVTVLIGLSSCATIILGSRQGIGFSSSPSKARIYINGEDVGTTPKTVDIKKKDARSFKISIELEGYEPYETVLSRKTSGWIAGNIVLGGLIGLAVDLITGGAYVLTPEYIEADLEGDSASLMDNQGSIMFFVTLNPSDDWVKIGDLVPVK